MLPSFIIQQIVHTQILRSEYDLTLNGNGVLLSWERKILISFRPRICLLKAKLISPTYLHT